MKTLNEIKRILIAIEDSMYAERAASYGFDLAKKLDAEVGLIHVNDILAPAPFASDPLINESQMIVPEVIHAQEDAGKRLLNRIADQFGEGFNVYTYLKIGNTKDEILSTAEEWKADLLILGTHGRSGIDHFISGSITDKIVRKSKCPVLVIPNKDV